MQRPLRAAMRPGAIGLLLLTGAVATAVVVTLGLRRHGGPNRCGSDWVRVGARCCAPGQSLRSGHCRGMAQFCPAGFHQPVTAGEGCVFNAKRVRVGPITLSIGPSDWQSEQVNPISANVAAFSVDAAEVNHEQWQWCVAAKRCRFINAVELGQPVTGVTLGDAQAYCAAMGGRLPNLYERMALAAGADSRRYPWGQTGLVCRRATFGVVSGPCAEHGNQPDVAGSHPDGQSPEGVFDLSGNVAELALDVEGNVWACGGSFRSRTALELKSWACVLWAGPSDDVGFRCAYDVTS